MIGGNFKCYAIAMYGTYLCIELSPYFVGLCSHGGWRYTSTCVRNARLYGYTGVRVYGCMEYGYRVDLRLLEKYRRRGSRACPYDSSNIFDRISRKNKRKILRVFEITSPCPKIETNRQTVSYRAAVFLLSFSKLIFW